MKNKKNVKLINFKAFTIIEILIWIFIFSLWMVWIFAIISSTSRLNDYNENYIIASNLANEQIELIKNIRDSNYEKIKKFNQKDPSSNNYNDLFEIWKKYKVENNYNAISDNFPIIVEEISNFIESKDEISWDMTNYILCLDSFNRYTFDCSSWNTKTRFYKYVSFEELSDINWKIDNAYLLKSKVIWFYWWYHEFEIKSVLADWKRL